MHKKIAVIVYTIDPENKIRLLLLHNKPFNGYMDEWTFVFGDVENYESLEKAALREAREEFGIIHTENLANLNYKIIFKGKKGETEIHFFILEVKNINTKITLNDESIGYDWMLPNDAKLKIQYEDEKLAIDKLMIKINH